MKRDKKNKIGFVGLGIMGKPMVVNLIKSGYEVIFFARKKKIINEILKIGGIFVPLIKELPLHADILITNLPNTKDVKEVVIGKDGLLSNLNRDACVIDMSTISPEGTKDISATLKRKGAFLIDAPVSGGEAGAISGDLSIMVGGEKNAYIRVKPILSVLGKKITYIGGSGSGQICKSCNQILVAQTIHSISQIIGVAVRAKIKPEIIRKALLGGYANSKILEIHGERMIKSNYKPGFKLSLHNKDLNIAKSFTRTLGLNFKGLNEVKKIMNEAENSGFSESDSSVIHRILEKTYK
jgi:3-hydroxyisobutyrate dehydrogenase-like beta-hydroxyacid dehydrogenase